MTISALLRPLLSSLHAHRLAALNKQARWNASMALYYTALTRKSAAEVATLKQRHDAFTNADIRQINWK